MAYYKPLKGLQGIQIDFNKFQFSWNPSENDNRAHFLWIYKEDELDMPQMWKYAQCIDNHIQAVFRYNHVPLQEMRKIKFLIFLSDEQKAPSQNEIYEMGQTKEFICEVCSGTGEIKWRWVRDKSGVKLSINSDKKIPEGLLYYEYMYGNRWFCYEIPGEIYCGDNDYGDIYFPDMVELPQIKSREPNLKVQMMNGKSMGKVPENKKNGGILKKMVDIIRH